MNREIAERVDRIPFLASLDDKFLGKLTIGESWQAEHARRISGCKVAAELICETVQQRLGVILTESTHFPHDLVLAGRRIENEVWRWGIDGISDRFESLVAVSVEVEIDVADTVDVVFGAAVSAILDGIHSYEDVGTTNILIGEPGLKTGARYGLSLGDSLNCVACRAIPHEDRSVVRGFEKLQDILRSCQRSRCEHG